MDANRAAAVASAAERSPEEAPRTEVAWACCHRDVLDGFDALYSWRDLKVPLTIGSGGASDSPSVRDARIVAYFYGVEPMVFDGAGHRAHRTHPDHFADFVVRSQELGGSAG